MIRAPLVPTLTLAWALLLTGCPPESPGARPTAPAADAKAAADPTAAPEGGDHGVGPNAWCGEHGVPEAVCTRCDESLIASFKAKKDWCAEHGLPESQCIPCNPEVEAKWQALAPKGSPGGE